MKNQKGFSLIELLIVVVIIGIIAAIAIPNLLASRRSANEGSTIASLRTLTAAQATYQASSPTGNFGTAAALEGAGLIDSVLGGSGMKSGYTFTIAPLAKSSTAPARFDHSALPQAFAGIGATGSRSFYSNESGVIYAAGAATIAVADPATRIVPGPALPLDQ